ncbi:unnamed protein product, partial [Effrenium voratum]
VLRQAAHLLLANGTASASELGRWLHLAPNATVKVSFPYKVPNGTSTLNLLQPTAEFMAAENVTLDGAPPWTLKRPGSWHMRLQDAIAWAQRHPTQDGLGFVALRGASRRGKKPFALGRGEKESFH